MTRGTKIWLWCALVLSVATTFMNASYGRWPSVGIALMALAGLCVLLFKERKWGFFLMCASNIFSFVVGVYGSVTGGTGILVSIVMSFIGSALIPGITYFFLRKNWDKFK